MSRTQVRRFLSSLIALALYGSIGGGGRRVDRSLRFTPSAAIVPAAHCPVVRRRMTNKVVGENKSSDRKLTLIPSVSSAYYVE